MVIHNEILINTIIELVKGYQQFDEGGFGYLIGQVIRQYNIPETNYHYTTGFEKLWKQLTDEEISGSYTERFAYTRDEDMTLRCYSGSSHKYTEKTLVKGDKFKWNDIFHYEHTMTISSITDKLVALETVDYDSVKTVLDSMHVTRMTKEENISLHNNNKRDKDFESVVKNLYNAKGVYLVK